MQKTLTEGEAKVCVSVGDKISRELEVFYNPVMKFNRDTTVLLLKSLARKNLLVADIMAASGVRAIRFLKELPEETIKQITLNDLSKKAVSQMKKNLKLNKLDKDKRIIIANEDANKLLFTSKKFDYIDIDPFGTPNPFLDASLQRIRRNGILAVTATDTGALAGAFADAGIRKYWAVPLKNEFMHETGLRILIRKVQLLASHHDLYATPILSFYKEHYYRVFFTIKPGRHASDKIIEQHKYLMFCSKCLSIDLQSNPGSTCKNCNSPLSKDKTQKGLFIAGPIWTGNLGDEKIISKMLKNCADEKQKKFLDFLLQESQVNTVGFYDMHEACETYGLKNIPRKQTVIDLLIKDGYVACPSHIIGTAVNTNAPIGKFMAILKSLQ